MRTHILLGSDRLATRHHVEDERLVVRLVPQVASARVEERRPPVSGGAVALVDVARDVEARGDARLQLTQQVEAAGALQGD